MESLVCHIDSRKDGIDEYEVRAFLLCLAVEKRNGNKEGTGLFDKVRYSPKTKLGLGFWKNICTVG